MRKMVLRCVLALACFVFTACAVITVNVYFPEKAAKEAYKSLDEMLLKPGQKGPGQPAGQPAGQPVPGPAPAAPPEARPQTRLFNGIPSLSLVSEACAADNEAEQLAVELADKPEVLKAYDDMRKRLPRLTQLLDAGAVGISNQGLISVRDKSKVPAQDEAMVAAENQSRKTVVTAMAKAILKLNKQKENSAALGQVMGKAASTFADTRHEEAHPGWWIQLGNGRWVQK
jgi:uncharacterized protein